MGTQGMIFICRVLEDSVCELKLWSSRQVLVDHGAFKPVELGLVRIIHWFCSQWILCYFVDGVDLLVLIEDDFGLANKHIGMNGFRSLD